MKKIILLMSCLIIIGMQLKAQNKKFLLGVMSSLDFYKYKYNDIFNKPDKVENFPCYHLGLKAQYDFNEKFSLRSGISFSKIKYKCTYIPIDSNDPIYITNPPSSINKLYNLNIPLMVGYTVYSKGYFKLTPSFGYVLNVKIAYRDYTYYTTYTSLYENNTIMDYHSLQLNLGCEYKLRNKYLLTVEPYLNYKFNKEKDYFYIISSPYIFGGILSINYNF